MIKEINRKSGETLGESLLNPGLEATPLDLQLDVFDHGEAGVLDKEDKVRINYRDSFGNLVKQSQIFSVQEFLNSPEINRTPLTKLGWLKSNGTMSEDGKGREPLYLYRGMSLSSVRWFSTAPLQEEIPLSAGFSLDLMVGEFLRSTTYPVPLTVLEGLTRFWWNPCEPIY